MARILIAGALLTSTALPALADVEEYFVALDTTAKQCRVMSTQPDGTMMKKLGGASYKTLDEAEEALARLPECNS